MRASKYILNKGVLWHNQVSLKRYFLKKLQNLFVTILVKFSSNYEGYQLKTLSQFMRKSDDWILPKPNKLKILSSFSISHAAMATNEILRLINFYIT